MSCYYVISSFRKIHPDYDLVEITDWSDCEYIRKSLKGELEASKYKKDRNGKPK